MKRYFCTFADSGMKKALFRIESQARSLIKKSINAAPEYVGFYDIANEVNKIRPDKEFEEFLNLKTKENNIVLR